MKSMTPAQPTFAVGARYIYVQPDGIAYLYDFRGLKTRGRHKGRLLFEHSQLKNHWGNLSLPPNDPKLQHIKPYVPHPASMPYVLKERPL